MINLRSTLVLATIFAFFFSEVLTLLAYNRSGLLLSGPVVALCGIRSQVVGKLLSGVWLFLWLVVHSPPYWDGRGGEANVVDAGGCGFIAEPVLIESEGYLYLSKSRAVVGDRVRAHNKSSSWSRASIVSSPSFTTSNVCFWADNLRTGLVRSFESWPEGRRQWLQSFVLGSETSIDQVSLNALRRLGLLHIVVLSGGHLAVIAGFLLLATRGIPMLLYSARLITMKTWPTIWKATGLLSVPAVILFSFAVGLSQSVQRALLMFFYLNFIQFLYGERSRWELFQEVWILQCILFPVHVYSLTMLLTWCGSLILYAIVTSRFKRGWLFGLLQDFKVQLVFATMSLLAFGQTGFVSVLANLVFTPAFSVFLVGDLLIAVLETKSEIAIYFVEWQMMALSWIRWLSAVQMDYPFLLIRRPDFLALDRITGQIVFVCLIIVLLYRLRSRHNNIRDPNF